MEKWCFLIVIALLNILICCLKFFWTNMNIWWILHFSNYIRFLWWFHLLCKANNLTWTTLVLSGMPMVVFRHLQWHILLWRILNVSIKISQMHYTGMHCIFHTTSTKSMWPCLTNDITREVISFQTFWHLVHNAWTIS